MMCDLGGWDGAMLISGRALADLAVALDLSIQPTADAATAVPRRGLSINCTEQLLNLELLVPRLLYATWSPDWDPDFTDADDDLERLHARLLEVVRLTQINILTGQVLGDPGNRLTFVRDPWLDGSDNLPTIELDPPNTAPNTIRLSFTGKVLIAANFMDSLTVLNSPAALDFAMSLDYRVRVRTTNFFPLDLLNMGLSSLPFTMLGEPCAAPATQRLPPTAGRPVWAQNTGVPCVTSPGVQWRLTTQANINAGTATLFTGAPGDCILDPDDNSERWQVVDSFREPNDTGDGLQSEPIRQLMDTTCNQPVAEAGKGHAGLVFDNMSAIAIFNFPVITPVQRFRINESLMKLDGFLVGAWLSPLFQQVAGLPPPSPPQLAALALLGAQAMDFAPLPAELTLPLAPRLVTGDGVPYVQSDVVIFQDAATQVFGPLGNNSGAIALGGRFGDLAPPAGALPENFANDQDLAVGVSETLIERWVIPLIEPVIRNRLSDEVPNFDNGAFSLDVDLAAGHMDVQVWGSGAIDAFVLDLPFDFQVDFPLRLRMEPALLRLNDAASPLNGRPVDALSFALPEDLSCLGLDVESGDVVAPLALGGSNPLCFFGYLDPRVLGVLLTASPPGPWIRVSGNGCPACALPSALCPEGPAVNPSFLWRQTDFGVPPFPPDDDAVAIPGLRPGVEVAFLPPAKDDVHVSADFDWWVDLLVGLFAAPFLGLGPLEGTLATVALADMLALDLVYPGLRAGIAGQLPLTANKTTGWQVFLQHSDPTVPTNDAITIDANGLCMLFRVIPRPDLTLGSWAPAVCTAAGL